MIGPQSTLIGHSGGLQKIFSGARGRETDTPKIDPKIFLGRARAVGRHPRGIAGEINRPFRRAAIQADFVLFPGANLIGHSGGSGHSGGAAIQAGGGGLPHCHSTKLTLSDPATHWPRHPTLLESVRCQTRATTWM